MKSKFILGLITLFLIVSGFGIYGYLTIRNNLIQEHIQHNIEQTRALETRISRWLERRKTEISTLANTPVVRSMEWSQSGPFLKQKHETMPWFYIFAHINPDGSYYNSKVDFAEGQNLSDRAHFQASINGRVYASDPVVSRTLGTDIVAVTSPIYRADTSNSDIIGVFGGMIDTTTIVDELGRFSNGANSYAFALNSTGIAISHPDKNRMGNINTNAESLTKDLDPGLSKIATSMLEGKEGWERVIIDGQDAYVTFTPVAEADWYLATVTDAGAISGQITALNIATLFVASILGLTFYMVLRLRNAEEQRLQTEKSVIEEKNQAKSNFLANVSHELRTPLNAIIGYSDLLQGDNALSTNSVKRVEAINKSGKHLLSLINRILDLAKVEAGKLELDNRPANLAKILNDTSKSLEITAQNYPVTFSTSIEVDKEYTVDIDSDKLIQIINNITTNAFKYGGSGHVTLAAYTKHGQNDANQLIINVVDQGIGISKDEINNIFNEFEQIDSKSSGLGLGLAIVKQLTTLMGGEINIKSDKGVGTSVEVKLPINEISHEIVGETLQVADQGWFVNGQEHKILVIDDNEENTELMRDLFTSYNFSVATAKNGVEGLDLFNTQHYDMIITDIVMPKKNGFEVIKEIRSNMKNANAPIIVASASAFASDKEESLACGANVFMAKPIDIRKIMEKTCHLLDIEFMVHEPPEVGPGNLPLESIPNNMNNVILDQAEKDTLAEILQLAELGRFSEIRKQLVRLEDPKLLELRNQIFELVSEFNAEEIIAAVNSVYKKNDG